MKMAPLNLRRKISLFMAVLLIYAACAGSFGSRPAVLAASPKNLLAELNRSLVFGLNKETPDKSENNAEGNILLRWTIERTNEGLYTLIYPLSPNRVARLDVNKTMNLLSVDYQMDVTYAEYSSIKLATEAVWETRLDNAHNYGSYTVNTNRGHTPSAQLAPPNPNNLPNGMSVNSATHPDFTISAVDSGFSFVYGGRTIHFLWTFENGAEVFYFSTDGLSTGLIYNYKLYHKTGSPIGYYPTAADLANNYTVFTGLKMDVVGGADDADVRLSSYASDFPYTESANFHYEYDDTAGLKWYGREHHLLEPDDSDPEIRSNGAGQDNRIEIVFGLPLAWDDSTGVFSRVVTSPSGGTGYDYAIPEFSILFQLDNKHQVWFNDILSNTGLDGTASGQVNFYTTNSSVSATPDSPPSTTGLGTVTALQNRIYFTLCDLPSGIMYNESHFQITSGVPDTLTPAIQTSELRNKVFTFLDYEIKYDNGVYYAVVTNPYRTADGNPIPGEYTLATTSDPKTFVSMQESAWDKVTQPSDGTSEVWLSFNAVLLPTPQRKWHFISFMPSPSIPEPARSQITAHRPSLKDITIGRPNQFHILDDNMSQSNTDASGTVIESEVTLELCWDIASNSILDQVIQTHGVDDDGSGVSGTYTLKDSEGNEILDENGDPVPARYIELAYDLGRVSSPNDRPGLSDMYATITVTIASHPAYVNADGILVEEGFAVSGPPQISGQNVELAGIAAGSSWFSLNTQALFATVKVLAEPRRLITQQGFSFSYPGIYFLTATSKAGPNFPNVVSGGLSMADTLILDDYSNLTLPPPQSFTLSEPNPQTNPDKPRLDISFTAPYSNILDFLKSSTRPNETEWGRSATFDLYITQDEQLMIDFSKALSLANSGGENSELVALQSSVKSEKGNAVDGVIKLTDSMMAHLRNGFILRITDIQFDPSLENVVLPDAELEAGADKPDIFYSLDGFDKNQKYFAAMSTFVTYYELDAATGDPISIPKWAESDLTGILSVTTNDILMPADPAEKAPGSPVLTVDEIQDSWAAITWEYIKADSSSETIEYEILRTTNPVDPAVLGFAIPFASFFSSYAEDERVGFRRSGSETKKYNAATGKFSDAADLVSIDYLTDVVRYKDQTLTPNSIYYIYVRSVKVINGEDVNYSAWRGVSITTKVVRGPINLVVLRQNVTYDPRYEMIVQFDAPLASLSQLNSEFFLEYSIREDNGPWSTPLVITQFYNQAVPSPNLSGYFRIAFKISGLKHNTGYSVRVRLVAENGEYSMWSNIAETKTDLDQEEYDKLHDTNSWIDFLKRKLADEFKGQYWPLIQSGTQLTALYRISMQSAVIGSSTDASIVAYSGDLNTGRSVSSVIIYLPAGMYLDANAASKGFIIQSGNLDVILPPEALNESNNAVTPLLSSIKTNTIVDYYVRLTVTFRPHGQDINGKTAVTSLCDVRGEAVGAVKSAKSLDREITDLILDKLADDSFFADAVTAISGMLQNNVPNTELVKYVDNYVAAARQKLMSEANGLMTASLRNTQNITEFSKPFYVRYRPAAYGEPANGYRQTGGQFTEEPVVPYGGGWAVSSKTSGSFIFTGFEMPDEVSDLTSALINPGSMTELIGKYGLSDILDGLEADKGITLGTAANIVARISGADKNDSGTVWLASRGFSVNGKTAQSTLANQEAMYLVMALYELKTGQSVSTMLIRNYGLTAGIMGIDSKYLKYVQAAFETGVYDNKSMNPKTVMSVKDFLDTISRMNDKIKL